tara:strand:- start:290 stop:535 length:246 start_codon:yes stop_codon:yes gene_type:complete
MVKRSPIAIFMAASAILAAGSVTSNISIAGEDDSKLGGLKEWTTDQGIEEESTLDENAKKAAKKAKKADICIPIGEGENCW